MTSSLKPRPPTCITCCQTPHAPRCYKAGKKRWAGVPRIRALEYRTAEYRQNRKLAIEREPQCHWKFPHCTGKSTQADHIIPVAQGGTNELSNLVGSCGRCNAWRGSSLGGAIAKIRRKQQRGNEKRR